MFERPDYVIVGAGSAGCVLASRLSEDPSIQVVLLEAGPGDGHPFVQIPIGAGKLAERRLFDWGFQSEPEPTLGDRPLITLRGKVLGGSSSINFMAYTRGDRGDFDGWARAGLAGWGWDDVLPYFKRAETWAEGPTATRGGDGPLGVEYSRVNDGLPQAWMAAARAAGIGENSDPASGDIEGFGRSQFTIRNGRRSSTANAYLKPARGRKNLQVITDAHVTRIVWNGRRAQGVIVDRGGQATEIHAAREVILSAGVYKTPQILMLSGVGPSEHLGAMGISTVEDLPVGRNLQDHWSVVNMYARRHPGEFHGQMRLDRMVASLIMAQLFGVGAATTIPSGVMGFHRSDPSVPAPDIEFMFPISPPQAHVWFPGIRPAYEDAFGIRPAILHPFSRGDVVLASSDPVALPKIRFNVFSDQRDLMLLVRAFRLARQIANDPALDPFRGREIAPGLDVNSDDEIEAFIRATATTGSHPCGTCAMGEEGVLDERMRVHRIEGLRVVDSSAMPTLVSAHINACVIMMAEKAADLIKADNA